MQTSVSNVTKVRISKYTIFSPGESSLCSFLATVTRKACLRRYVRHATLLLATTICCLNRIFCLGDIPRFPLFLAGTRRIKIQGQWFTFFDPDDARDDRIIGVSALSEKDTYLQCNRRDRGAGDLKKLLKRAKEDRNAPRLIAALSTIRRVAPNIFRDFMSCVDLDSIVRNNRSLRAVLKYNEMYGGAQADLVTSDLRQPRLYRESIRIRGERAVDASAAANDAQGVAHSAFTAEFYSRCYSIHGMEEFYRVYDRANKLGYLHSFSTSRRERYVTDTECLRYAARAHSARFEPKDAIALAWQAVHRVDVPESLQADASFAALGHSLYQLSRAISDGHERILQALALRALSYAWFLAWHAMRT